MFDSHVSHIALRIPDVSMDWKLCDVSISKGYWSFRLSMILWWTPVWRKSSVVMVNYWLLWMVMVISVVYKDWDLVLLNLKWLQKCWRYIWLFLNLRPISRYFEPCHCLASRLWISQNKSCSINYFQAAVDIGKSLNQRLVQALESEEKNSTTDKVGFVPIAEYTSEICEWLSRWRNGQVSFVILNKSAIREIPSACTLCYCWWQDSNGCKGGQVFVEVLI